MILAGERGMVRFRIISSGCMFALILSAATCISPGCRRAPVGLYVSPARADLQDIEADGGPVSVQFSIANTGTTPVHITDLYPSCRCTSVSLSNNPVSAGGESTLTAMFDPTGMGGVREFDIVLATDSAQFPWLRMSFAATIVPASNGSLRPYDLGVFRSHEPVHAQIPVSALGLGVVTDVAVSNNESRRGIQNLEISLVKEADFQAVRLSGEPNIATGRFVCDGEFQERRSNDFNDRVASAIVRFSGTIMSTWSIPGEIYGGFFDVSEHPYLITFVAKRNAMFAGGAPALRSVSMSSENNLIELIDYELKGDRAVIRVNVVGPKGKRDQFVDNAEIVLFYSDGSRESHRTRFFWRVD